MNNPDTLINCIQHIASEMVIDYELIGHEWQVTVTALNGAQITFIPSQLQQPEHYEGDPPRPTPAAVISALWGRTYAVYTKSVTDFFIDFRFLPAKPAPTRDDLTNAPEAHKEFYREWRRCAEWSKETFGEWFGFSTEGTSE